MPTDPAAAIEALPVGGVFHGSGCYITGGIVITKPVTIDGGTYNDPVDTYTGRGSVLPIIRVKDTSYVTIENVVLNGANTVGGFHLAWSARQASTSWRVPTSTSSMSPPTTLSATE